jgi:hypothetical protein
VALLLDDLHWADPASRDLLRVVARGLADLPLLLLATYRADEVARDHPLATLLPLLVREARAARLDPRPLTPDDLRALVRPRYALPPADEDRLVAYLGARTEGNPLYAGEVLRALAEAGTPNLATSSRLCATPGAAKAAGDDYWRRGRRGLAGAGGGASRATTVASHARACGDASQGSAASAV